MWPDLAAMKLTSQEAAAGGRDCVACLRFHYSAQLVRLDSIFRWQMYSRMLEYVPSLHLLHQHILKSSWDMFLNLQQ